MTPRTLNELELRRELRERDEKIEALRADVDQLSRTVYGIQQMLGKAAEYQGRRQERRLP